MNTCRKTIKDMEKIFDFEQVGKRMPYIVPDGFFDKLEADVMQDVKAETTQPKIRKITMPHFDLGSKKTHTVKIAVRSAIAVAATVALFFVVRAMLPKSEPVLASADDFASVDLAFNNLSIDDQDFLIAVYEDEEYINVLTNTEDYE